ncbi:hypothetical protein [Paenibacillus sp. sgz302251]|uniref:hypothetical protein n=1 Tax=Paenibacillus sp. sgz302251 TaxID=3414493 RepID=UPI003C7A5033
MQAELISGTQSDFTRLFLFSPISFPIVFPNQYPDYTLPALALSRFKPSPWSFSFLALTILSLSLLQLFRQTFTVRFMIFTDEFADDFPRFSVKHGVQVLQERELGEGMRCLVWSGIWGIGGGADLFAWGQKCRSGKGLQRIDRGGYSNDIPHPNADITQADNPARLSGRRAVKLLRSFKPFGFVSITTLDSDCLKSI